MSCGNPEAETGNGEQLMPPRRPVKDKSICSRCRVERAKYLVRSASFCKTCFPGHLNSRLVKTLYPPLRPTDLNTIGKNTKVSQRALSRPLRQPGGCLIGISGGAGSLTLLDLLLNGSYLGTYTAPLRSDTDRVARNVDKKKGEKEHIWVWGVAVHVDFSGVTGLPGDEEDEGLQGGLQEVKAWVESRGIEWKTIRAEYVFDPNLEEHLSGQSGTTGATPSRSRFGANLDVPGLPLSVLEAESSDTTPLSRLRRLHASLPPASRPALLQAILSHILSFAATSIPHVSHVLLGETSTRQAQRVISGTALGRGWSLPLELSGAVGNRLRPMKELSYYECAVHCHLQRIPTYNYRSWLPASAFRPSDSESRGRGKGGAESIETLTESFIANLDVSHPSTVHTINRTGEKLVFGGRGEGAQEEVACPVCEMPVDPSPLAWKARSALTSLGKDPVSADGRSAAPVDPAGRLESSSNFDLAPLLCYACLTTFTPSGVGVKKQNPTTPNELVELPLWLGRSAQQRSAISRTDMRQTIGEFLLD